MAALNPLHAISFLVGHGWIGFFALGSVFLAVTGAEALYADMSHFGRGPIRLDWFTLVLPALVLNCFGQGALVLSHPEAVDSPFYRLFPDWALYTADAGAGAPAGHERDLAREAPVLVRHALFLSALLIQRGCGLTRRRASPRRPGAPIRRVPLR